MSALQRRHILARCLTAAALLAYVVISQTPIAQADNCSPGDFGAAAGCAPPAAAGGDKAESWPPTGIDWPPDADTDADSDKSSQQGAAPAPIVIPNGATQATPSRSTGQTTTTPTPIVPVGSASAKSAPAAIVTPGS